MCFATRLTEHLGELFDLPINIIQHFLIPKFCKFSLIKAAVEARSYFASRCGLCPMVTLSNDRACRLILSRWLVSMIPLLPNRLNPQARKHQPLLEQVAWDYQSDRL